MNSRSMFDLSGRVAMVTGCSVGLGRQMAEGLAEMGANLVLCSSLELEKSILAHPAEFGKNGSGVRDR